MMKKMKKAKKNNNNYYYKAKKSIITLKRASHYTLSHMPSVNPPAKVSSSLASVTTMLLLVAVSVIGLISCYSFSSSLILLPSASGTAVPGTFELSPQPVYQEVSRQVGENLINETHVETTFVANGTLTLPNTTVEAISTTSTGSILISLVDSTAIGEQVITTTEGGESATAKFFGIAQFNMEEQGAGRGVVVAMVQTNSTGMLAPFNGMILVGQGEFSPEGISTTRLWEWESGLPSPTRATATATPEDSPPPPPVMEETPTATDATADDTTATATTAPTGGEAEIGGDETRGEAAEAAPQTTTQQGDPIPSQG
jgi:hypothetical protein